MRPSKRIALICGRLSLAFFSLPATAQTLYWSDDVLGLRQANPDGSEARTVVPKVSHSPSDIAFDPVSRNLFLTDNCAVRQCNPDGSDLETVLPAQRCFNSLALDIPNRRMYLTDPYSTSAQITSAALDGSDVRVLINTGLQAPRGIAIDPLAQRMYWFTEGSQAKIQSANLDGSDIRDVVTSGLQYPRDIAIDPLAGKLYWSNSTPGRIQCSNLDGTNTQDWLVASAYALALDASNGFLYWIESGSTDPRIRRATLDGGGPQDVVTQLSRYASLALDTEEEMIYWADYHIGKTRRAKLDGSAIETLIFVVRPEHLALDWRDGRIYWAASAGPFGSIDGRIQRSNLNGTMVEDLLPYTAYSPQSLAVDPVDQVLHWPAAYPGDLCCFAHLERANTDGTNYTLLPDRANSYPAGVAVDLANRDLYWIDQRSILPPLSYGTLLRTPLDNFSPELVPAAVDIFSQALAWSETDRMLYLAGPSLSLITTGEIQRFDPVTNHVTDVATFAGDPFSLAVDPSRGFYYFTDIRADQVIRTPPGANRTEVVADNVFAWGIALDPRTTGDIDFDGAVDLRDIAAFQNCFSTGLPAASIQSECTFFDTDLTELRVDLLDFADFYTHLTGPN